MADTRVQLEVEDWVRENWMRERFGQNFNRSRVKLSAGGVFDFDALSDDGKTVACISTSSAKTAGGKHAVGKLMKIRSDMLFLLMAVGVQRRMLVVTEKNMYDLCVKEQASGRAPDNIEFVLAEIPDALRGKLIAARALASKEVSPLAISETLPDELLLSRQ